MKNRNRGLSPGEGGPGQRARRSFGSLRRRDRAHGLRAGQRRRRRDPAGRIGLQDADPRLVAQFVLEEHGLDIEWPELNMSFSIPEMLPELALERHVTTRQPKYPHPGRGGFPPRPRHPVSDHPALEGFGRGTMVARARGSWAAWSCRRRPATGRRALARAPGSRRRGAGMPGGRSRDSSGAAAPGCRAQSPSQSAARDFQNAYKSLTRVPPPPPGAWRSGRRAGRRWRRRRRPRRCPAPP